MAIVVARYLEEKWRRLLVKRPALRDYRVVPLREAGLETPAVSDFIERQWDAYYGDQPRLHFTAAVVGWLVGPTEQDGRSLALLAPDGGLGAVVLAVDRPVHLHSRSLRGCLATALAVDPAHRGLGLLAGLEVLRHARDLGYDVVFEWFDSRHERTGSAFSMARGDISFVPIKLWGKTLDIETTGKYQRLTFLERAVMSGQKKLIPRRLAERARKSITSEVDPVQALMLYESATAGRALRRDFSAASMEAWLRGPGEQAFAFAYAPSGVLQALVQGFWNRAGRNDRVAYVDMALFSPSLSYSEKARFLRAVEEELQRVHGCFGIVVAASAVSETLLKLGYVPFDAQVFAASHIREDVQIPLHALRTAFMDLR